MKPFIIDLYIALKSALAQGATLEAALSATVGGSIFQGGIWRFFSAQFPPGGVALWNSRTASWKQEWGALAEDFYAFGEDIFGNQLIIQHEQQNAYLWDHESGEKIDLYLDPTELLQTILQQGLDWIDYYRDGSLVIAKHKLAEVPLDCHLHWTTPLILGGAVTEQNTSVVQRSLHLKGHAKLWKQVSSLAPGTIVLPKHTRQEE